MKKVLLLEIGTEELPISIFPDILSRMSELMAAELAKADLAYETIDAFATPRRLVVMVKGLAERQPDKVNEVIGPPYKVAFDQDGQPTKAALGFAQKQGVDVKDLIAVETPKGKYVGVRVTQKGRPAKEVLTELLPRYILSLSFPKSMRWYKFKLRFVRPIHWLLALLDEEVVPFSLEEIKSGNVSYGHRFVSQEPIEVSSPATYLSTLKDHYVIVDHNERQEKIMTLVKEEANEINGEPIIDKDLLNWVVFLVEYPLAIRGKFASEFLSLPEPVLITVMKQHQKYFAVRDEDGKLLPAFVAIINTPVKDKNLVRVGLERVLSARLADARFFYETDLKQPLSERIEALKGVIFQADLGTVWEKVERIKAVCAKLAERVSFNDKEKLIRAAQLCKADLTTEMVGEFPELQGIMGGIYAEKQGEDSAVAKAIAEHYLPTEAGGALPETEMGALLSLADKIDTIVGCFGVGLIPTGTADPFGLRRQAIGILRILKEKSLPLSLFELVELALNAYGERFKEQKEEIKTKVVSFFKNRLAHLLMEIGYSHAITSAILSEDVFDGYIPETFAKAEALKEFSLLDEFEPLVIAYKRVNRIIEKPVLQPPNPDLFEADEERTLYAKFLEARDEINSLLQKKAYLEALHCLLHLKPYIDQFFDHVMVMVDDADLRQNRLALLTQIRQLFLELADLSKIPI